MGCGLCPVFVGKWEGKEKEKVSGKKISKIFFLPASAWAGKKGNSAVQNGTVLVFFLRKRNVIWKKKKKFGSDPKMGYDIQSPLMVVIH
jgi:hypothetical protein